MSAREAFYERIGRKNMTPLWVSLANLVTPEPVSGCQPASWSFADIRAAMIEAGASWWSGAPRDIIVAPSWKHVTHEATDEAVLFSFSDRPIQELLNLFREERGDV